MKSILNFIFENDFILGLIAFIIVMAIVVGMCLIFDEIERGSVDGSVIIDKMCYPIRGGKLGFYLVMIKDNDKIVSLRVDETEYYTYHAGDIFKK